MRQKMIISILVFFVFFINVNAQETVPLKNYLEYARNAADWTWANYDSLENDWVKKINPDYVFGYRPPARFLEMAAIYAFLYEAEGNIEYAKRAKKVIVNYKNYRKYYPQSSIDNRSEYSKGLPALPDFFTSSRFIRAYDILKYTDLLSQKEIEDIDNTIAHSTDFIIQMQEWGTMNRGILRAEGIAWAVRAVPNHPHTKNWEMLDYAIGFDNWGNWEIEDASLYNAIWLYSLIGYADAKNSIKELFKTPEMYYYAYYYLNLICPDGFVPDFGDAHWRSNWSRYLVFFETAAAQYKDENFKWAASNIALKMIDFDKVTSVGTAYYLLDCYRFGAADLVAKVPTTSSMEVMEDNVGKKIVFRNGWQPNSTYMLLNYRDEGESGIVFKDYLRDTLPVEEEKMTHGHSDENSLVCMMKNGTLLLHDGGYRNYMPSGPYGSYRQDYFHNKLCVRQEKIWMGQKEGEDRYAPVDKRAIEGQNILDFLHNAGSYRQVRTQKYDFITLPDFDYSRTRLIDDKLGYEWDRIVTYVKDPEMFIVFDIMKARVREYFTASNLWHTRKILNQGEHWYETVYDSLRGKPMPEDLSLIIYFPKTHFRLEGVEEEDRYYQKEFLIHQTTSQEFELGQYISFVTVLVPHDMSKHPQSIVDNINYIETAPKDDGLLVQINSGDKTISVGAKCDLRKEMIRSWRRPKYTYESGKIVYDNFESNCDFFFTTKEKNKLDYTVVNFTKALFDGNVLYDQLPINYGLSFDGSPDAPGVGKVRYWRDSIQLK